MENKVIWDNQEFDTIDKFNCVVVSLSNKVGGGYTTVIPISSPSSRMLHPTKAYVEITTDSNYTTFYIYSDWGKQHVMEIPNHMKKEIESAKASAIKRNLITLNKTK